MPKTCLFQHVNQHIIPSTSPRIFVHTASTHDIHVAACMVAELDRRVLGIALKLSDTTGRVEAIALASGPYVYHIRVPSDSSIARYGALSDVLDGRFGVLCGYQMARIALHVHRDLGLECSGVELGDILPNSGLRLCAPAELVARRITPSASAREVNEVWFGAAANSVENTCLRAWLSTQIAERSVREVHDARIVCTRWLHAEHLAVLGRMVLNMELLEASKPTKMDNEFDAVEMADGQVVIQNSRYKTRVRASRRTEVVLDTKHGELVGRAVRVEGRQTSVHLLGGRFRGGVERVRVLGREEVSMSESVRDMFLLHVLREEIRLRDRPFIDMLWFAGSSGAGQTDEEEEEKVLGMKEFEGLNVSQCRVAAAMISKKEPLVIVQGPPGTGKTTTIAAAVAYWQSVNAPVWVVARSNVAVRNIARSLLSNNISGFKLLVSKEFYFEWHEEIYARLRNHLIRSNDLVLDPVVVERQMGSAQVVLCTLSMLSNIALDDARLFHLVPMERLVVDEASQIDTFEFMHIFHKFRHLRKVCLFGDPQQLPPFGQEKAPGIRSIFDFTHLKSSSFFLNVQYRMPTQLGHFISEHVYNSQIESEHWLKDTSCVAFVDVAAGHEEKCGTSHINKAEAEVIVDLVRHYYRDRDFCVITPYDAQRALIQRRLKAEQLPSDRVFNVDSFQGHEAAYVLISAVRTVNPGFLRSQTRMNVMLTRCEAGMVVVTRRSFVETQDTLLGKLARWWERKSEESGGKVWFEAREIRGGKERRLPGVDWRGAGRTEGVEGMIPEVEMKVEPPPTPAQRLQLRSPSSPSSSGSTRPCSSSNISIVWDPPDTVPACHHPAADSDRPHSEPEQPSRWLAAALRLHDFNVTPRYQRPEEPSQWLAAALSLQDAKPDRKSPTSMGRGGNEESAKENYGHCDDDERGMSKGYEDMDVDVDWD
ncbi:hypothetical protein EIP91_001642 [Steccherinum ochraceum]|uniref:DNA2/NAM7 helicase-like C-terminal domain-containing protein n=1 Tax=Steccherinum ochraceum TaxID=92696 RepID=A0A4R0RM51_9APHY|nr:hypothetical protein EIP91_001642 [Steccherinum ochraceum]